MIRISKEAAHKLHDEYGVPFGENGISKNNNSLRKGKRTYYYLCESEYNIRSYLEFALNDEAVKILEDINKRNAGRKKKYKKSEKYAG